jgi:hypothetical protein
MKRSDLLTIFEPAGIISTRLLRQGMGEIASRLDGMIIEGPLLLVRFCTLGQEDRARLAGVSTYYSLVTRLHASSSRICEAFPDWAERERGRCSYFVAVALDRRITNTHKLRAEQMMQPEKQGNPRHARPDPSK